MRNLLIVIALVVFASGSVFALTGKEFTDCLVQAQKVLKEDNKKCHEQFGQDGSKDRKGFTKCKYLAKDKYNADQKACQTK